MKKYVLLMTFLAAHVFRIAAQELPAVRAEADRVSIGLGGGMDFGGLGLNVFWYPQKNIGFLAGAGYAIAGAGYNAGVRLRLFSCKNPPKLQTNLLGMYGYHAVILDRVQVRHTCVSPVPGISC